MGERDRGRRSRSEGVGTREGPLPSPLGSGCYWKSLVVAISSWVFHNARRNYCERRKDVSDPKPVSKKRPEAPPIDRQGRRLNLGEGVKDTKMESLLLQHPRLKQER